MKKGMSLLLAMLLASLSCAALAETAPKATDDINDRTASAQFTSEKTFPYVYTDAAGREIVIEKQLGRIAVDYLPLWESMIMLGVQPVGMNGSDNYSATWDALQGYDLSDVVDFGSGSEINLELLATLEPDLILTQAWDVEQLDIANYEKLAPVAVFDNKTKMDWKESLRQVGALLGLESRAESVIQQVEERLAAAKTELKAKVEDKTVMQMSLMGEDRYFITWREELYGEDGLGLKTPEGYTAESGSYVQVSLESIVEMNPDYLFINVFDGDEAIMDALFANSVWQSMDCVKNNRVFRIDGTGHANSALSTLYTVNFIIDALNNN